MPTILDGVKVIQTTKVSLKDTALESWCLENNYRLIRLEHKLYKNNEKFWLEKVDNEIYNGKDQIVKFWTEESINGLENFKSAEKER